MKPNKKNNNIVETDKDKLFRGVILFNSGVLGLSLGLMFGLGLFLITNWLVITGGDTSSPHILFLSQLFIGYKITFVGSFIGFFYGFVVGTLGGALIGWIYNKIVEFRN